MSKDWILQTEAPRKDCHEDLGVDAGHTAGGDCGCCALEKEARREPASLGRQHPVTTAVTSSATPSGMHCGYTPTLLGALKISSAS